MMIECILFIYKINNQCLDNSIIVVTAFCFITFIVLIMRFLLIYFAASVYENIVVLPFFIDINFNVIFYKISVVFLFFPYFLMLFCRISNI
jgi:hypothetical protein